MHSPPRKKYAGILIVSEIYFLNEFRDRFRGTIKIDPIKNGTKISGKNI